MNSLSLIKVEKRIKTNLIRFVIEKSMLRYSSIGGLSVIMLFFLGFRNLQPETEYVYIENEPIVNIDTVFVEKKIYPIKEMIKSLEKSIGYKVEEKKVSSTTEIRRKVVKELEGWNPKKQVFGKIVVTKEEMMKIVPDMIVEEILTGVPALGAITIAQWKIESKCGHSVLAKQTNNLYGIKHVPKWDASPETWMKEFRAGYKIAKDDKPNDKFIRFKSQWACIRFHTKFLTILRYKKHIGKDYKGWATGLRTSGYATDKSYTDHLLKCYKELDLAYIEKLGYKMRKWKNY